jgi:hypothetical protein
VSIENQNAACKRASDAGADINTVAQLLGLKDLRMTAQHDLSPAFLAEAVPLGVVFFGNLRYQRYR